MPQRSWWRCRMIISVSARAERPADTNATRREYRKIRISPFVPHSGRSTPYALTARAGRLAVRGDGEPRGGIQYDCGAALYGEAAERVDAARAAGHGAILSALRARNPEVFGDLIPGADDAAR